MHDMSPTRDVRARTDVCGTGCAKYRIRPLRRTDADLGRDAAPLARALRSARIMSLARSAIMIVGEFVLPDVINGITDASTTRRPRCPARAGGCRPPRRHRPRAHAAGADRMEDRRADRARRFRQFLVGLECRAGQNLLRLVRASAGADTMRRVSRIESAATLRSSSVDR
jgi:hypothetical protein